MIWAALVSVPVVLVAVGLAWLLQRRQQEQAGGLRQQLVGYPVDRVDEVLARLDARIAANDALLRQRGLGSTTRASASMGRNLTIDADASPGVTEAEAEPAADDPPFALDETAPETQPPLRWGWVDLAVIAAYVATALHVLSGLIGRTASGYLSQGVQDHQAFEWYFGASAHNVATLSNPFFSDRQNFPDGVNLMANATVTGLGIPLAPLTLIAGAHVTFFVVELLGLAGTAAAWYWFFRRRGLLRVGAALGGWFTGFAPAMVSHANGHPNFVAQFLLPVIVDRLVVLGLREPGRRPRPVRDGVVLGLLVAWQVFIGEEPLLLMALALLVVGVVLLAHGLIDLRPLLTGVGVGAAVCLAIVAGPLWWQFFGPQSYTSIFHPPGGNDLAALWGRATRTVGADPWASAAVSMNRTEENSFFGVPLWLLSAVIVIVLFRRPVVRALAVLVVFSAWLSLGEEVVLRGRPTGIPGLWALLDEVPILENVLATRFAMMAIPAFAGLIAIGVTAAFRASPLTEDDAAEADLPRWQPRAGGWLAAAAAVLALAPVFPTALQVDPRPPVPPFFTGDAWRDYVDDGSVLAVPPTDIVDARAFDWQLAADTLAFPIVEGYFVGPDGGPDRGGQYGATRLPFSLWLYDVNAANVATPATPGQRQQFLEDLRTWRTDAVVLPVARPQADALRDSLVTVLGEPQRVADVYVWDVRELTS
ncbi:hypothetical protein BCF74_10738 [Knoellia remsis]|uniref:Glycosyl transferase n=1 Tax=Knoellia remsis TaxID=407159 RepID=A0A2T0UQP2_9MICO|nr:glycosyl transferase [Knoellia remsis]PRY60252.1 hypothetical protein BCF74_10738 [Knoellia remsis]